MESSVSRAVPCVVCDGTRTASRYITPMLNAWARDSGYELFPGTLNVCAKSRLRLYAPFIALDPWRGLMALAARRNHPHFSPRLYPAEIKANLESWVYRWSDEESLLCFVGGTDDCPPEANLEIVSPVCLRKELGLKTGDTVSLRLNAAPCGS